jgi:hypothetical protein
MLEEGSEINKGERVKDPRGGERGMLVVEEETGRGALEEDVREGGRGMLAGERERDVSRGKREGW